MLRGTNIVCCISGPSSRGACVEVEQKAGTLDSCKKVDVQIKTALYGLKQWPC
jgi:hypothetical protein